MPPLSTRARDLPSQSKEALGKEMEFLELVEAKYGASAQATPQSANPAMESAAAMQSVGESMSVEEAASAKGEAPFQAGAGTVVTEGWGEGGEGVRGGGGAGVAPVYSPVAPPALCTLCPIGLWPIEPPCTPNSP